MEYRIKLRWLIFITFLIRCLLAISIELGNDEVYYYSYALQPDWNHFDHPPLIGLLIRITTLNLHWVNDFSMRLGAIACAAINTWLIAAIARMLWNERTAFIVAILFSASLFSSIISGVMILPDALANCFWIAAMYSMLKIIKTDNRSTQNTQLLLLGLWIGLACLSKVHCIMLWFGFLAYLTFFQRRVFLNPYLYLSLVITAILLMPIICWNVQYDFITWKFHSNRVSILDSGFQPHFFFQNFFGQVFYNNPLLIYLYICLFIYLVKEDWKPWKQQLPEIRLLLAVGLPIILLSLFFSLFRQVLPHWSGAGYFSFMLISAFLIDQGLTATKIPRLRKFFNRLLSFTLVLLLMAVLLIRYYPGNFFAKNKAMELGKEDVTLDMTGWREFAQEFKQIREEDIKEGKIRPDAVLLLNNWFPGGHLLYYVGRPLEIPVIAAGNLTDIHKFAWLNKVEGFIPISGDAYFIAPSNSFSDPEKVYKNDFEEIQLARTLEQKRGNQTVRKWYIYRLRTAKQVIGKKEISDYLE